MAESLYVQLSFHPDSSSQARDADHAYLFEKLKELIQETSAFSSYRVLTDEDNPMATYYRPNLDPDAKKLVENLLKREVKEQQDNVDSSDFELAYRTYIKVRDTQFFTS